MLRETILLVMFMALLSSSQPACPLPNLSVGDFNITSEKQLRSYFSHSLLKSGEMFLLGVSASWCTMCCAYEDKYSSMYENLQETEKPLKLARIDVQTADFIRKFVNNIDDVPKLYAVVGDAFYPYVEESNGWIMYRFTQRMLEPVKITQVTHVNSVAEFHKFWDDARLTRRVIGVVYDEDRDAESDYGKFMQIAYVLASLSSFEIGLVTDRGTIKQLKQEKSIQFFDSILVRKKKGLVKTLDQATKAADTVPLTWILSNSLDPVEELVIGNMGIYTRLGLPMLLLFLDPNTLKNDYVLEDAAKVAENHRGQVTIAWIDGTTDENRKKRRDLGLMADTLPAASFNLVDDRVLPFDESRPLTYEALNTFVDDFLNNRLKPRSFSQPRRLSYEFDSLLLKVPSISHREFTEKVLSEGEDVCVFFYSTRASDKQVVEKSKAVAGMFAKLEGRLEDLVGSKVRVFRYDLGFEPSPRGISIETAPSVYVFPAYQKLPPYAQYVGDNQYFKLLLFIATSAEGSVRFPKLKEMIGDESDIYESVKHTLPKKITDKIEEDEKVRSAEWL